MAIDDGFRDPWVRPVLHQSPGSTTQYDELEGEMRLRALNDALSGNRHPLGDRAAGQAADWLEDGCVGEPPEGGDRPLAFAAFIAGKALRHPKYPAFALRRRRLSTFQYRVRTIDADGALE